MIRVEKVKMFCLRMLKSPTFYFCLIFMLLNLFFTKQILNSNELGGFLVVGSIEVLIEIILVGFLYYLRRKGAPLEKQFLLVAIALGAMFIVLLPPGQSPDEQSHFRRAYEISNGVLVSNVVNEETGAAGSWLPGDIGDSLREFPSKGTYSEILSEIGDNNMGEYSDQAHTNTALYNFVCYIPQTLAILVGKVFGFSILGMAYLVEIFNFAVWVILIYFAIKLTPKFKSIILFIALLPITLKEATSLAHDSLTIGLSMFLVAYALYLTYVKKNILKKRELALLCIMAIVIGFCKIVYLPLVLLFVMIPHERFGGKKKKWWFLGILALVVLGLNLLWLMISSQFLIEFNPGVNSREQLAGILRNPLGYLMVIVNTANVNGYFWLSSMLGMMLGSFSFGLPIMTFFVSFGMLVVLFMQRDETLKMKNSVKCLFALVFLAIFGLICTSLYLQWTVVGAEVIDGIQGRYFLPILLLLPVIICRVNNKKHHAKLVSDKAILHYSLFINILACVTFFAQNV